jgi:hypothetical protein
MKITWGIKEIAASGSTLKKANTQSLSQEIAKYVYAELELTGVNKTQTIQIIHK